jgi:hypothetical protein
MNIRNYILDHCLKYLLANKAPKTITTSTEESKHFGFWAYLDEGDETFVFRERDSFLRYQCTKFNPAEEEKDVIHIKTVSRENGLFFTKDINVRLFYNGFEASNISPLIAYLYGKTHAYIFHKWYLNVKWARSQRKHKKALSHYKDRFRLLEALTSLFEEDNESLSVILSDSVEINSLLLKLTNSNDLYTTYTSRKQLDPVLRSLQADGLIEITDDTNIKLNPKAWSELSMYYLEERRHADNMSALRWQRILMFFLVLGSLTTAFLTFIRPDVQSNIKSFILGLF